MFNSSDRFAFELIIISSHNHYILVIPCEVVIKYYICTEANRIHFCCELWMKATLVHHLVLKLCRNYT